MTDKKRLQIYCDPTTEQFVRDYAKRRGISVSDAGLELWHIGLDAVNTQETQFFFKASAFKQVDVTNDLIGNYEHLKNSDESKFVSVERFEKLEELVKHLMNCINLYKGQMVSALAAMQGEVRATRDIYSSIHDDIKGTHDLYSSLYDFANNLAPSMSDDNGFLLDGVENTEDIDGLKAELGSEFVSGFHSESTSVEEHQEFIEKYEKDRKKLANQAEKQRKYRARKKVEKNGKSDN